MATNLKGTTVRFFIKSLEEERLVRSKYRETSSRFSLCYFVIFNMSLFPRCFYMGKCGFTGGEYKSRVPLHPFFLHLTYLCSNHLNYRRRRATIWDKTDRNFRFPLLLKSKMGTCWIWCALQYRVALSLISGNGGLLFHFVRSMIEHGGGDGDGLGGDPRPLKLAPTLPEMNYSI